MGGTVRIGRIAGVRVDVHWSVLVIFGLIALGLSTSGFPATYPGYPRWAYALAGLCAAAVFMLGLLAHEVSHSVVAQRNGIEVEGITLWLFGGVSQLKGEATDPGMELRIAGVGPLVSLVLGVLFGAVTLLLAVAGVSGLLVGVLGWLAAINVLLALFNVIPAAPLDGGRLLRAALWRWRGDRRWAAVAAARAGRLLGFVLVAVGLLQFLTSGSVAALWLGLIGWFVAGAATAEERQAQLSGPLGDIAVRDVMTHDPEAAPAAVTVADFVEHYLFPRRHSTFPVVDGGHLVGLVTLRRVKEVRASERTTTTLRDISCPVQEIPVVAPDQPLTELLGVLNRSADGRVLVMDGARVVGIVSPSDVSRVVEQVSLRA